MCTDDTKQYINCPVCNGKSMIFFKNGQQPLFSQALISNKRKKVIEKRTLSLAICQECSHVFSTFRDSSKFDDLYKQDYMHLRSDLSSAYVHFLKGITGLLSRNSELGSVLEIGSHDGYFLKLLSDLGWQVSGIDPSPISELAVKNYGFDIKRDFFSSDLYRDKNFNLVVSRYTLEHIADPVGFLLDIKRILAEKGKIYIEVPSLDHIIANKRYQDICFEHLSYFTLAFLTKLVKCCGFKIIDSTSLRENKALAVFAENEAENISTKQEISSAVKEKKIDNELMQDLTDFNNKVKQTRTGLLSLINSSIKKGNKWVIWGAGVGATNLISFLGLTTREVMFAVDSDPGKWGRYLPGTDISIKNPNVIKKIKPDVIFIISDYQNEISKSLNWFTGRGGKVLGLYPQVGYLEL